MAKNSKFAELMKDTKHLETLAREMQKEKKTDYGDDSRYWKPEVDKAGNGYAVVRFLPISEKDWGKTTKPYVHLFHHGFKGPTGQWYIENSLTTNGVADPVSEYNTSLWNEGSEEKKNVARSQKRKLTYIANILVLKDERHPENEGKVFLFKYGVKIHDKLVKATEPDFPDEPKFDPFHFIEGANFKLKIRNNDGGFRNYDASDFEKQSPLFGGDEDKLNALWESQHSLLDEIGPSKFKSYDELKKRLELVLGAISTSTASSTRGEVEEDDIPFEKPYTKVTQSGSAKAVTTAPKAAPVEADGDDDDLAMFQSLARN